MSSKGLAYRFKFYFFGFGLGCVMVWAMFYKDNDRRLSTPQGKVLGFLEQIDKIAISDKANCQLSCLSIDADFMNKELWKEAEVNFSESATQRKPCPEYVIITQLLDKRTVEIYMETCLNTCNGCEKEYTATLRSIKIVGNECDC
jgi:hypothetical protein